MNFQYVRMSTKEEAEKYYSESGHWIVANVNQAIGWPENKIIIYFREIPILLIPESQDQYPAVAVLCKMGISKETAEEAIKHFLSSLSWSQGKPIEIESWTGGGRAYVMGRSKGVRLISKPFRITYLPDTIDPVARLALAFYREAMFLNHPAYSFLSYYKIINIKHSVGNEQKAWIEKKLLNAKDWTNEERLASLRKEMDSDIKIAEYLYHSCRCAIAHADVNQKIVNPEDYDDMARLRSDLPLIKSLAEILIEEEFGILRPRIVYKEHPYELFGFKSILGDEVIQKVKSGEATKDMISFPNEMNVRLWGESLYPSFEVLKVEILDFDNGTIVIQGGSSDNKVAVVFALDFINDRIIFDPQSSIRTADDDGSVAIIEHNIDACRFLRRYWANGILEIWDSKTEKCLGFSDAFVPVNIDLSRTISNFDKNIKAWEQKLAERKAGDEVR